MQVSGVCRFRAVGVSNVSTGWMNDVGDSRDHLTNPVPTRVHSLSLDMCNGGDAGDCVFRTAKALSYRKVI